MRLGALSLGRDPETLEHSSVGVGHFLFEPATAALDNASRADILRVTGEQHFRQATVVSNSEDALERPTGDTSAPGTRPNALADVATVRAKEIVELVSKRDASEVLIVRNHLVVAAGDEPLTRWDVFLGTQLHHPCRESVFRSQQGCVTDAGAVLMRTLPFEHGLLERSEEPFGGSLKLHPVILELSQ